MIKLIHSADLHLDSPFDALPDALAKTRREEQRGLLERIVALADERDVKLILLAGDVLDSASAYFETARLLCEVFARTDARIFISPGNHDPATGASPYSRLTLPENVHIFMKNEIECVEIPELSVRVWGAGFEQKFAPALLTGFFAKKLPGVVDLMVMHGNVGKSASPYNPMTEDEIAGSGMDYIALGHYHETGGVRRAGNTFYAYSGCPEGRGFDECGEKTVFEVSVTPGACAVTPRVVAERRYEILEIDVTGCADIFERVTAALPRRASRDVYRVVLTGETDARPDIKSLCGALSDRFFYLQLRDKTTPARNIWRSAGHDTLRGLFLDRMREKFDAAEDPAEKEKLTLAVRLALAALDGMEEP